jgi:hypothetical protein
MPRHLPPRLPPICFYCDLSRQAEISICFPNSGRILRPLTRSNVLVAAVAANDAPRRPICRRTVDDPPPFGTFTVPLFFARANLLPPLSWAGQRLTRPISRPGPILPATAYMHRPSTEPADVTVCLESIVSWSEALRPKDGAAIHITDPTVTGHTPCCRFGLGALEAEPPSAYERYQRRRLPGLPNVLVSSRIRLVLSSTARRCPTCSERGSLSSAVAPVAVRASQWHGRPLVSGDDSEASWRCGVRLNGILDASDRASPFLDLSQIEKSPSCE